mgnify:CR=1 FL=1
MFVTTNIKCGVDVEAIRDELEDTETDVIEV